VARFDGVRFVAFGLREHYRSGPVRSLLADGNGGLWIGSVGGLTRWSPEGGGQFSAFTIRDGLPADSVTALAADAGGRIWVGTEAGVAVLQNGHLEIPPGAEQFKGRAVTALFTDRQGTIWLGASGAGVFHYAGEKFVPLADASVEELLQDPHCLLVDQAGRIWVGAGDDFVLCREGDQWRRYRIPRHFARPYVSALAEEPDGTVWAGSVSEGLFQFKAGKLTPFNASTGLSDNLVESLLVDREGKLWVGTDAALNRRGRRNLAAFGQNEGLGYGAVQGLAEIAPGVLWAAKPGDGLYRWESAKFVLSRRDPVNVLLMALNGACWAGGEHGLLLRFPDAAHGPDQADAFDLKGLNVTALEEDHDGTIWVGTREGQIWRMTGNNLTPQTNIWQSHPVTAIVHGSPDSIWVGTGGGGLYRFQGDLNVHYVKAGGLLSDFIRTLYLDGNGTLWIGTAGGGLSRWRDGRITSFTTREGLPDNTISQIIGDGFGRLWLGSNRGIACVAATDLDALAAGRTTAIYPQIYGLADGMVSEECAGGFCPAGLKSNSGLLWFPTLKGIVMADPRPRAGDALPTSVVLEEVLVDGVPNLGPWLPGSPVDTRDVARASAPPDAQILRIPPGHHRIEVHFTGLNFDAPERVRFRYRLSRLDADWVEGGTSRSAFYSYVPQGDYKFEVEASNTDGTWNDNPATLSLSVAPYFWQTWWFIGLASLGLLGGVGGAARFVEKRKLQRRLSHLEQERALERERARIAQDLHDDLGSSLTRISLLSGLTMTDRQNPALVEDHAAKIAQSAAQTVRALEEIVWAVRPGSDSLQSLVEYIAHFANELFDGDRARCRLDLPPNLPARALPPDIRHNIFLVVKEALTNALKHASAKEVRVQAKASDHELEILVQDDGQGFDMAARPGEGRRNGMGNMRRRADAMAGTLSVVSAPGRGTTVRLAVHFPDDGADGTT
jgi:signal transduction histidine kinase/ligand-binding sensor domain-containing protein